MVSLCNLFYDAGKKMFQALNLGDMTLTEQVAELKKTKATLEDIIEDIDKAIENVE